MIKLLIKNQIRSIFAAKSTGKKKGKTSSILSRIALALLMVLLAGVFLLMFGGLFYSLAEPLYTEGLGWFYFSLAVILAWAVSLFCTVFYAQPQIYGAKDNDLLLSMPIKPSDILFSRLTVLYLEALLTASLVLVPAGVVWCFDCPVTFLGVLFFVLGTLLVAALSMAVALAVGAAIAWILARFKRKNLLSAIGFALFFTVYIWGMDAVEVLIEEILVDPSAYVENVRGIFYPAYAFGMAVAEQNVGLFFLYALIALAPTALVCYVLSRTFLRLITTKRGEAKVKYRQKAMKVSSPLWAFTKKELRHLTANVTYLLNAAIGVVLMPVISVMLLVTWSDLEYVLMQIPGASDYVTVFLPLIPCFFATTVLISAATVSIEGKNLWIAQSSPCDPGDILMAKALSHIVVACPAALVSSLLLLPAAPDFFAAVSTLVIPQLFVVFTAFFGVALNLWMPKLDYENDVAAIKRGGPSMLLMLAGVVLCALVLIVAFNVSVGAYAIMTSYTVLLLL